MAQGQGNFARLAQALSTQRGTAGYTARPTARVNLGKALGLGGGRQGRQLGPRGQFRFSPRGNVHEHDMNLT